MTTPSDDSPTRIGDRYRLDERIGAGAMGAVWLATDELLNRPVAVKELLAAAVPARAGALEESRQRILREGRIGARLQHPHVIRMFDVVVHEDSPWLVMEYLPSQSLAQRLGEKGPMQPREAADIGRQVADGLGAAHRAGVVHRDIKPGNVLLGDDGQVKLTDFGVSRAADDVQLTRTGLIAGTPAFLSPEAARGQDPTPASDVFALGATLYAAVEGQPPFGLDDNAYALLHKVANGAVTPPTQAGPLTEVMMRLLSVDPAHRPTADQARDLLAGVARGAPALPGTAVFDPSGGGGHTGPRTRPTPAQPAYAQPPYAAAHPTPPPPSAAPSRAPARAGSGSGRRFPAWAIALVVAFVLAGGVAVMLMMNGQGGGDPAAAPATTAAPAPAFEGQSPGGPYAEPTTSPVDHVDALFNKDLLTEDPDAALKMVSPEVLEQFGGKDGWLAHWGETNSVWMETIRGVDSTTCTGFLFAYRDNGAPDEKVPYTLTVQNDSAGNPVLTGMTKS